MFVHKTILSAMLILTLAGCNSDEGSKGNVNYPVNKPPLLQASFIKLPLGAVKPEGWLKQQLEIQAKGLTGYVDEFYLTDSRWKGGGDDNPVPGTRDSWAVSYLNGLVKLGYILDDARLKQKAREYVEWIISSAQPDGWFGPPWEEGYEEATVCDPGHQKRALSALMLYHEATKDPRIIPLAKNFMRFMMTNIKEWPSNKWWGMGVMNVASLAYWLYNETGDPALLEYVRLVHATSFNYEDFYLNFPWDTKALNEYRIPWNWTSRGKTAHGPLITGALVHPAHWFLLSGDVRSRKAVFAGLENLVAYHGQAGGRISGDEHISGKRPTQGSELCGIISAMEAMETLFEIFGDPSFEDRLELLAFNSLPGTLTPDFWAHQYVQQANQVLVSNAEREWSTNPGCANIYGLSPHYPCCLFSMHRGFPGFVEHMWMATPDNGILAAAYGPSRVTAQVADHVDISILEETDYPFDGGIRMTIDMKEPTSFPLHLRVPGWADGATITAGGESVSPKAGTIHIIRRTWRPGDVVEISFPMKIRTERRYNQAVSILRGPVYYSLRIGKKFQRIVTKDYYCVPNTYEFKGTADWEIQPTTDWNYGLLLDPLALGGEITVRRNPISRFPFADVGDMLFLDEENRFETWGEPAPVVLSVKGKALPAWTLKNNSADDPPPSPVLSAEPIKELELVPYGCARLRITEFPLVLDK